MILIAMITHNVGMQHEAKNIKMIKQRPVIVVLVQLVILVIL